MAYISAQKASDSDVPLQLNFRILVHIRKPSLLLLCCELMLDGTFL